MTSKIYISENRYPGTDLRCVYLLGNGNSLIDFVTFDDDVADDVDLIGSVFNRTGDF